MLSQSHVFIHISSFRINCEVCFLPMISIYVAACNLLAVYLTLHSVVFSY
jgi:hypothetical protein